MFSQNTHATCFSQWLMTNFLSAEFIRGFGSYGRANLPVSPNLSAGCCVRSAMLSAGCEVWSAVLSTEIFRQCRSTALQKKPSYLPIATRHLPFTVRQSLFTAVFGSVGTSPSHFISVPRPTTFVPFQVSAKFFRYQLRTKVMGF